MQSLLARGPAKNQHRHDLLAQQGRAARGPGGTAGSVLTSSSNDEAGCSSDYHAEVDHEDEHDLERCEDELQMKQQEIIRSRGGSTSFFTSNADSTKSPSRGRRAAGEVGTVSTSSFLQPKSTTLGKRSGTPPRKGVAVEHDNQPAAHHLQHHSSAGSSEQSMFTSTATGPASTTCRTNSSKSPSLCEVDPYKKDSLEHLRGVDDRHGGILCGSGSGDVDVLHIQGDENKLHLQGRPAGAINLVHLHAMNKGKDAASTAVEHQPDYTRTSTGGEKQESIRPSISVWRRGTTRACERCYVFLWHSFWSCVASRRNRGRGASSIHVAPLSSEDEGQLTP
ncbi:unnamed protein product, partial [Amoebophrya sp. A120]|eukprot:GSA120T00017675001.1